MVGPSVGNKAMVEMVVERGMTCCASSVGLLDVDGNMYNFIPAFMAAISLGSDGGILVLLFEGFNGLFEAYIVERCDMDVYVILTSYIVELYATLIRLQIGGSKYPPKTATDTLGKSVSGSWINKGDIFYNVNKPICFGLTAAVARSTIE